MNAITLIWKQVLKELKLFQMKENKEDAVEKTDKEPQKTLKCHEAKYTIPLPDTAPPTGREKETERKQPVRLTQEVRTFLQKQYDFRYNLLTEETEYRPANKRAVPFEPVSKRELNTFCMEAHDQGISCWDKDLSRYIYSTCIPEYHPFRLYMEELPGWDGTDRLEALAQRVSDHQLWIKFPYLDAGTHRPMDGHDGNTCQQCSPHTCQQRAGTTKIHILQGTDAAGIVTLLHGQPETVCTRKTRKVTCRNGTSEHG